MSAPAKTPQSPRSQGSWLRLSATPARPNGTRPSPTERPRSSSTSRSYAGPVGRPRSGCARASGQRSRHIGVSHRPRSPASSRPEQEVSVDQSTVYDDTTIPVIDLSKAPGERQAWDRSALTVYLWAIAELIFVTNPWQISSGLRVRVLRLFGAEI